MTKTWIGILAALGLVAGCAGLGPTAQETQAVRIEGTPGMAVIYLVRTDPDVTYLTTPVLVAERMIGSTHPGSYYRLEVPAGRHVFSGSGFDSGSLAVDVQADRVYFVQHTVTGHQRITNPHSFFRLIDEARAREAMARAEKLG